MKNQTIIVIFVILLISGTFFVIQSGNEPSSDTTVTNVSNEQDTNTTFGLKVSSQSGKTLVGEGLYLIQPPATQLAFQDYPTWDREYKSNNFSEVYYLRQVDSRELTDCENFENIPESYSVCLPTQPENYNEFIVLDAEKKPLYQFELATGYSLVPAIGGRITTGVDLRGGVDDNELTIRFSVYKWPDLETSSSATYQIPFEFYPRTGELIQRNIVDRSYDN